MADSSLRGMNDHGEHSDNLADKFSELSMSPTQREGQENPGVQQSQRNLWWYMVNKHLNVLKMDAISPPNVRRINATADYGRGRTNRGFDWFYNLNNETNGLALSVADLGKDTEEKPGDAGTGNHATKRPSSVFTTIGPKPVLSNRLKDASTVGAASKDPDKDSSQQVVARMARMPTREDNQDILRGICADELEPKREPNLVLSPTQTPSETLWGEARQ
ncbi:hypothetical protein F4780DRAFT_71436 [Xylariomycetidae sp. FL0641]|nr:hypothetical protein F4780DRAFT_71436 [Xylariomycetidae sp. FL0641]